MRSVTNCVYFIPYVCPYAHFTDIPTRRGFSKMQHRHIACLVKNGEQMILYMKTQQIV